MSDEPPDLVITPAARVALVASRHEARVVSDGIKWLLGELAPICPEDHVTHEDPVTHWATYRADCPVCRVYTALREAEGLLAELPDDIDTALSNGPHPDAIRRDQKSGVISARAFKEKRRAAKKKADRDGPPAA